MRFSLRVLLLRLYPHSTPVRKASPRFPQYAALAGTGRGLELLEDRLAPAALGTISTVAGGGVGDGAKATLASLSFPFQVAVDSAGDLFIADSGNNRIREVNHTTGVITPVAGTGVSGYSGNGQAGTSAMLDDPTSVAVDAAGDLFIADSGNNRIREVNHATGIITTVAGNGIAGFSGDGQPATSAELNDPAGLAVDSAGDLFIADSGNNRIREVNHTTGVITTVAGNGIAGYSDDGTAAIGAELYYPQSVTVDAVGDLFIADGGNNRIREVNHATGIITTVAGNGASGYSGDGQAATSARSCMAPLAWRWTRPATCSSRTPKTTSSAR